MDDGFSLVARLDGEFSDESCSQCRQGGLFGRNLELAIDGLTLLVSTSFAMASGLR
jgi:hypothetical protein